MLLVCIFVRLINNKIRFILHTYYKYSLNDSYIYFNPSHQSSRSKTRWNVFILIILLFPESSSFVISTTDHLPHRHSIFNVCLSIKRTLTIPIIAPILLYNCAALIYPSPCPIINISYDKTPYQMLYLLHKCWQFGILKMK